MSTRNDFQIRKNFNLREFQCRCCGRVMIDRRVLDACQRLRDDIGRQLFVTSGYRCASHNRTIGGSPKSDHLYGWAADIIVDGMSMDELANMALELTELIKRVGTYSDGRCVHIGVEHREDSLDRFHITPKTILS